MKFHNRTDINIDYTIHIRAATAGKAPKAWALPRVCVSIHSYKKQPAKKNWGRIRIEPFLAQIRSGGPEKGTLYDNLKQTVNIYRHDY